VGYSLTGDASEEALFLLLGDSRTGKSTFLEAIKATLGEYAMSASWETFITRNTGGGARPDLARLAGARFVAGSEVDSVDSRMALGLVKSLTGGDTGPARHLYKGFTETRASYKIWLAANALPQIDSADNAIWNRIRAIPFDHVVPEERRDPSVKARLTTPVECGAAILAWAVRGAMAWQALGLGTAEAVRQATVQQREKSDPLAIFISENVELRSDGRTPATDLDARIAAWNAESSLSVGGRGVRARLKLLRCESASERRGDHVVKVWRGFVLRPPS
jgi:putative DNA primase/helicase